MDTSNSTLIQCVGIKVTLDSESHGIPPVPLTFFLSYLLYRIQFEILMDERESLIWLQRESTCV